MEDIECLKNYIILWEWVVNLAVKDACVKELADYNVDGSTGLRRGGHRRPWKHLHQTTLEKGACFPVCLAGDALMT